MKSLRIVQLLIAGISVISLGATGYSSRSSEVRSDKDESSVELSQVASESNVSADVQALVSLGPRVAGTPAMDEAIAYLSQEYQKAGYVTEVQTFTYPKFEDQGSNLSISGTTVAGRALNGSPAGNPTAPLVAVPNLGRSEDFAQVDVEGKIAVVRRGEIRFLEKANNAAAAGAVGLIIVNNAPGNVSGTLGGETDIPVLSLSSEEGNPLLEDTSEQLEATLNVNTARRLVTGRNLIAHLEGVTQPSVLLGAHYDSVSESPGANDNASGTAVVLDIARQLAGTEQAREVWFVAFDGEEDGLHGSRAFVDTANPQFLPQLEGMINFDMVGINDKLNVGGTPFLTALVQDRSLDNFGSTGGSDHAPFASAGVPVLFFTRGLEPSYHTPDDVQVDPNLLEETVQVGLEATEQLLNSGE